MSYSRWSEGEVYVFATPDGTIICMMCHLMGFKTVTTGPLEGLDFPEDFVASTRTEMLEHLKVHKRKGHRVPGRAIERLEQEIEEEGDIIPPLSSSSSSD